MDKHSKIYVAGHRGLVGSAILNRLKEEGYDNIITRTHSELDLTIQKDVDDFFKKERPEYIFLAAAKVGGILENTKKPAEFMYINLMIQSNIIECGHRYDVKKLLFLGSSCVYPRDSKQPMKEEYLLSGKVEPTNEAYAIAKIAGIKMCQYYNAQYGTNFISVMPSNIYGPNDDFDLERSHVLSALIRKFHEAKQENKESVEVWGTGNTRREFLYVDDLADACLFLMNRYDGSDILNIGVGEDVSIKELAQMINDTIGYKGKIEFDTSKPDGMPQKVVDVTKINQLGWKAKTNLKEGLENSIQWYIKNKK